MLELFTTEYADYAKGCAFGWRVIKQRKISLYFRLFSVFCGLRFFVTGYPSTVVPPYGAGAEDA